MAAIATCATVLPLPLPSSSAAVASGSHHHTAAAVSLWALGEAKPAEPGCECRDGENGGGRLKEFLPGHEHCHSIWNDFDQWCEANAENTLFCREFEKRWHTDCDTTDEVTADQQTTEQD